MAWGSAGGHFFFLSLSWCFSLCSSFHVISKVTCTMVMISVRSIRISEIDIQHPSFRRKHQERSLQKAALLTPASLWGEFAEPVRTQSRLAFWVNALTAEAALTAYHKTRIFATKTPGFAPVRAAGSSAFSAHPFCTRMSTCTKQCPEVWQALLLKFETIYLKIVSDVVLSL